MTLPDLIYLDTAFIAQTYENLKHTSMPTRIVRKSNFSGGVSAGVISAGASMEESREYPVSSRTMYDDVVDHLNKIPSINLDEQKNHDLPELFWTEGVLGGGHSSIQNGDQVVASASYFEFHTEIRENNRRSMPLATNDVYFVSGFDQLSKYGRILTVDFGIRARLLVRLLYLDANYPVGAPMVIIKTSNSY